jgi:uncharacterized protein involved in exopolysaccharide biosynthesis
MQDNNWNLEQDTEENFNIKHQLERYLRHYKWFALSVGVFLIGAFLYLRYATPQYNVVASVLIKDDKKGGLASELGSFADLASLGGVKSNVDNEPI